MRRGEDLVLGRHQAAGGQRQHQDDGADDPVPLAAAPAGARRRPPHRRRPARRPCVGASSRRPGSASKTSPGPALVPDRSVGTIGTAHLGLVGQNGGRNPFMGSGSSCRGGWRGRGWGVGRRTGQRAQAGGQPGGVQAVLDLGGRRPGQHLVQRARAPRWGATEPRPAPSGCPSSCPPRRARCPVTAS